MLEECSEVQLAEQLERLLTFRTPRDEAPEELRADLNIVERLKYLNLSAESQVQAPLRAQLAQKRGMLPFRSDVSPIKTRPIAHPRIWVGEMAMVLLLFLLLSNTPVCAAIERWLGYGYLPYAGFIPLADTLVIQGPVTQSEQGWHLSILQGVRNPENTVLWIRTNLQDAALSAAELVLPDGAHLPIQSIQPGPETIRLTFDALSDQTIQTTLALPGGWKLPVTWIAANQAGLAPTQVSTPFGHQSNYPCVDLEQETQICAQAAYTDPQGTHLLLQALQSGQPVPLTWNAASDWQSIALESPDGCFFQIEQFEQTQTQDPSVLSMRFSAVSAEVDIVTLHLPIQVLSLPGRIVQQPQILDLYLKLPDRVPTRSATPGVVQSSPDYPIAVPTPSTNERSLSITQP